MVIKNKVCSSCGVQDSKDDSIIYDEDSNSYVCDPCLQIIHGFISYYFKS